MRLTSQSIARGWQSTKKLVATTWRHTTKIAGQIDHGMQLGRRILSAASPLLDQMGVNMRPALQGIAAYDRGKMEVMNRFNNAQDHYQRIRRQVPELDF